ncbi:YfiT family bacillithiol transferase [Ferroacidibacillus organovorans]|uniref:Putative metal-dependent hydrolase ATW55_03955 n=1 Tax=Ferroacidibacillus organovorans TaxID=1765683 RepID=A0A117SY49_9BACL|nr:bacillithiol transferase BstA [Ferroacidibacillus organovorans]KUO96363.1 metal-dependent hydrolase [Ferroacidibacillus organovorans]
MENLHYPIGKFIPLDKISSDQRKEWIEQLADTPNQLRFAIKDLTSAQLDTPYRPDGWSIRQVIHHLPDSHMNAYVRFKLALTEDQPTIKTYEEDRWSQLADYQGTPIEVSLTLLASLHQRFVTLLSTMQDAEFSRSYKNPESGVVTLETALGLYAWHGRHHIAHITSLRNRMGW